MSPPLNGLGLATVIFLPLKGREENADLPHQLQNLSKNVAVFFSFFLPPSLSLLSLSLFLSKAVGLACRVKKISKQILFF